MSMQNYPIEVLELPMTYEALKSLEIPEDIIEEIQENDTVFIGNFDLQEKIRKHIKSKTGYDVDFTEIMEDAEGLDSETNNDEIERGIILITFNHSDKYEIRKSWKEAWEKIGLRPEMVQWTTCG